MRFYILPITILLSLICLAQQSIINFKKVNGDDFPTLKGDIWFRNPNSINTYSVYISENGKKSKIELTDQRVGDSIAKNKVVIFLMVNPGPMKIPQFNWYRNVIASTLSSKYIQAGDKIQIMSFNQQLQGQLLFPSSFKFTDQTDLLKKQLIDMNPIPYRSTCGNHRTLIWSAIDQVLDLIEKENLNIPVSIVVISDDNSCITQQANQTPVEKAKKLGVSVYGISRNDNNRFNSIEKICMESFGIYYFAPNNDLSLAEAKVQEFMTSMKQRASGQYFNFSYRTNFENDGSSQPVTVSLMGSIIDTYIQMPEKTTLQWIGAHWFILFLIMLVVLLFFYILRNNKKETRRQQIEIEEKSKLDFSKLKNEHDRADTERAQQIMDQERQINQMRLKIQQEEEAQRQLQKSQNAEIRKKELLQQMKLRGNLPWLLVKLQGKDHRYEIDEPWFVIGRDTGNNLTIPASTISRRHALIKYDNGVYTIEDLNSSNGVMVNGKKYKEMLLKHGDVVQLGDVYLTFMI